MNSATIVQKLWNYCNVLRDDGMSYGDYVEQLTYLRSRCSRCRDGLFDELNRLASWCLTQSKSNPIFGRSRLVLD